MSGEKHRTHNSIDLSHHLSDLAKRRVASPIKSLQKYYKPGSIEFGGGKSATASPKLSRAFSLQAKYLSDRGSTGPQLWRLTPRLLLKPVFVRDINSPFSLVSYFDISSFLCN